MNDLQWWEQTAPTLPWTYAKSMPKWPHEYVVRDRTLHDPDFTRAVRTIRRHGRPRNFLRNTRIYLDVGKHRYWTMGDVEAQTTIINRQHGFTDYGKQVAPDTTSDVETVYDDLAPIYDDRYDNPACRMENEAVVALAVKVMSGQRPATVLDIGAGTGLALDLGIARPGNGYLAVDPSQAMLNELVRKHPTVRRILPVPYTETLRLEPHALALALFGTGSYLSPAALETIPETAAHGIVMVYREDYWPDYYAEEPPTAGPARETVRAMMGRPGFGYASLGNFLIATW